MTKQIKVRFAPSPTGSIHVGNARTALFNWLIAQQSSGKMVFRLEDTDVERSSEDSVKSIIKDVKWLGLNWDEGPYLQSERLHIYQEHLKKLIESKHVYKCYCSSEELEARREEALKNGLPPKYDGRCSHLTDDEIAKFEAEGKQFSYRFKVTGDKMIVNDLVRGAIEFDLALMGDFVIMRQNGYPLYNFSVVIDDALMGITHIMRGEDILPSTPKQILLYKAMGYEAPEFGHLSMINGPSGRPLHKRDGATSVAAFRESGYLPEAMFNFLALLGWSPKDDSEIMPKEEIIKRFSVNDVSKSPAQFNYEKLKWMNGQYLKAKTDQEVLNLTKEFIVAKYSEFNALPEEKQLLIIKAVKSGMELTSDAPELITLFMQKVEVEEAEAKEIFATDDYKAVKESAIKVLNAFDKEITVDNYKEITKLIQTDSQRKGKALFMSLRVALTGRSHGPELSYLFPVLGKEKLLERLN